MKLNSLTTWAGATIIGVATAGLITAAGFAADTSTTTSSTAMPKGETLAKGSDCFSCHAINQKIVGPSFNQVAAKFAGKPGSSATLVHAIDHGHVGTWGKVPMPPHASLSKTDTKEIVSWILAMKKTKAGTTGAAAKKYTYTVKGKAVETSFPIYQTGTKKVTPMVFRGYELYNSYCFRCHGADAVGGSYAPNLRRSLANGMNEAGFLSVAMTGVKAKGMPSWAGFFTPHQIHAIYQYVKARSVDVVHVGTPKH